MTIRNTILLLIIGAILALAVNAISPNGIPIIGGYPELQGGSDGPIVPPDAQKGDPFFVSINDANLEYNSGSAVFIDARSPEEFECGTIPGAVNIPFEYLPEGDLKPYFDSVLVDVPGDQTLIIFCSGEECDVSLHLGRNMLDLDYSKVFIFYGGAREWEQSGLEVERRQNCSE